MEKKDRKKINFDELDRISEANAGKLYGGNSSSTPEVDGTIKISITFTF